MSTKRRREPPSTDSRLIEIYEDLANEKEDIRLKAAESLLSIHAYENEPSSEQLYKALKRLLRGLCSGRKAARLGFSVALTELLVQLLGPDKEHVVGFDLTIVGLIRLLEEQTRVTGNVSGQENRDHNFGRLFGAEAILKSRVLLQTNASPENWSHLLDIIYDLAKKKSWLREECGWVLYNAIQYLVDENVHSNYAQMLIDKLYASGLMKTPEGIAIWLSIQVAHERVNLPKGVWHHDDPLSQKEKTNVAKILKEASTAPGLQGGMGMAAQKGTWSSKLHFSWDVVMTILLSPPISSPGVIFKRVTFQDFWLEAVDNSLFAASSSDERKYWGFLLFQRYFQQVSEDVLPILFSRNLLRCLINQLSAQNRYLHRIAEKTIKVIHSRVEKKPQIAAVVVLALIGSNGQINFDVQTKTKTIEKLLAYVQPNALSKIIIPFLDNLIVRPQVQDQKIASIRRQQVADHLVSVVRSVSIVKGAGTSRYDDAVLEILSSFVKFAYFDLVTREGYQNGREPHAANTLNDLPEPMITDDSRQMFSSRINSCLTHLSRADPAYYAYNVVRTIQHYEMDQGIRPYLQVDDAVQHRIRQAWRVLDKVHTKQQSAPAARKNYLAAFKMLYSITILQVYNSDTEAVGLLDELKQCYDSLIKHKIKGGQDEGSEVLIEILLSLVSRPSLLFRRLAQQVFSACTSIVNANGLQSMFKVLETRESLAGRGEIFDQADEKPSDIGIADMEELDLVDGDDNASNSDNTEMIEDSASMGTENDCDSTDDELAAFDIKLAQALGTRRADQDFDADSESMSTDEDMDDEQMEALDVHLEAMFKERQKLRSKKDEKKDAKETIINFKCRVLELLEIYIQQQHGGTLALHILLPSLSLIQSTTSKQVRDRACDLVRLYSRQAKALPKSEDSRNLSFSLLSEIHLRVTEGPSSAYVSACSQASILLAKLLAAQDMGHLRNVVDTYAETHKRLLYAPKSPVKISFFLDWLNWSTSVSNNANGLRR